MRLPVLFLAPLFAGSLPGAPPAVAPITAPHFVGESHPVLKLSISLPQPRTLVAPVIRSHDPGLSDFSVAPSGPLGAGDHELVVSATLADDVEPSGRPSFELQGLRFEGGDLALAATAKIRPAIPLHRRGEADCHTTRIPGLARTTTGTLLAVYDLRYDSSRDLQGHMDIGLSRSTDAGRSWEAPRPIMDMGEYGGKPEAENGCSDPCILVDPTTGTISVFALWVHGKPGTHQWRGRGSEPGFGIDETAQFMVVRSKDDGVTWSAPENLTRSLKDESWFLFAPAPGNGIALADGTLVLPSQGRDANGFPFSNLMWSRDHGATWSLGKPARDNTTESAVATLSDGTLLLNMRDNRNRKDQSPTNGRALSVTSDLGTTWTGHPADHGPLIEPVCMASMIAHHSSNGEHVLLFSNPHHLSSRRNITLQASLDDGVTWPTRHRMLLDEGTGFGYSSLAMIDDQTVGIVYESSRANLVFQTIHLDEIGL